MDPTNDVLERLGYLALGSRLKRLAERLQADALRLHEEFGYPIQPAHFPLLAALNVHETLTVGEATKMLGVRQPAVTRTFHQLVDLGLVQASPDPLDQRSKHLQLTSAGKQLVDQMQRTLWPHIEQAATDLAMGSTTDFLSYIKRLENGLTQSPLRDRVHALASRQAAPAPSTMPYGSLSIVEFKPSLAHHFTTITQEWLESMFQLEAHDQTVISDPVKYIIEPGGTILFVKAASLGIVGTCALLPVGDHCFELTKMGVLAKARGRKAGEYLLAQILERAHSLPIKTLYLLTSRKCEAAIHLYEKAGFVHDALILQRFGGRYGRCDIAMSYPLTTN